jgi:hypothetical protein
MFGPRKIWQTCPQLSCQASSSVFDEWRKKHIFLLLHVPSGHAFQIRQEKCNSSNGIMSRSGTDVMI